MNALRAWKYAVAHIRDQGQKLTTNRVSYECTNITIQVTKMDHITAPIDYLSQQKDWVYPSIKEIQDAVLGTSTQTYAYAYGQRLFGDNNSLDQINEFIIPLLKKNKDSRRACAVVMRPDDGTLQQQTVMSGVIAVDFKVRNKTLHASMILRSNDVFIGWPANIYQLFTLAEYVAARLDLGIGSLTTHSLSAHVFEDYASQIKRLLNN